MDYNFVTQPFTARHVRFTKKMGFGSLGKKGILVSSLNKEKLFTKVEKTNGN